MIDDDLEEFGRNEAFEDAQADRQEDGEQRYIRGSRAAWGRMLQLCLQELDYSESKQHHWILEREAAIAQLRDVCETHGDNDWPDDLHLADIIEKHLARHLDETETEAPTGSPAAPALDPETAILREQLVIATDALESLATPGSIAVNALSAMDKIRREGARAALAAKPSPSDSADELERMLWPDGKIVEYDGEGRRLRSCNPNFFKLLHITEIDALKASPSDSEILNHSKLDGLRPQIREATWHFDRSVLPKPESNVLTYDPNWGMSVRYYVPPKGDYVWGWYPGGRPIGGIWWRELPDPPALSGEASEPSNPSPPLPKSETSEGLTAPKGDHA